LAVHGVGFAEFGGKLSAEGMALLCLKDTVTA
jgi:hypothetical protein